MYNCTHFWYYLKSELPDRIIRNVRSITSLSCHYFSTGHNQIRRTKSIETRIHQSIHPFTHPFLWLSPFSFIFPLQMATTSSSKTNDTSNTNAPAKVKVHFVPVGSAPILKKSKFQIGADQQFASVHAFLRKILKLQGDSSPLFLYLSSAFCPSPEDRVGNLNDCFSKRGELIVHYSLQEAWG